MEALWVVNWKASEWLEKTLAKKTPRSISGDSFQSCNHWYCADRGGNKVYRRLPLVKNEGKEIPTHKMDSGNESQQFKTSSLMDVYIKSGSIVAARHLFDSMPNRNVVSWNMMIVGYAKHQEGGLALELYAQMHKEGVQPSARTLVGALKACGGLAALEEGLQVDGNFLKMGCLEKGRAIHSQVLKSGFESDIFVGNTLVDLYVKGGSMEDACHVFEKLLHRDVISWNIMISGYAKQEEGTLALECFARMHTEGIRPDTRTFVSIVKACTSLSVLGEGKQVNRKSVQIGCLEKGRAIHCHIVKSGFESVAFVENALLDMYAKCGSMEDAHHVFDALPCRDVVSWNAMIFGYAKEEKGALALDLYTWMQQEGIRPSARTFVGVSKACSTLQELEEGKQVIGISAGCLEKGRAIHSQAIEHGFDKDLFVGNTLVDMYARCGSMEDARHVFYAFPHGNVVFWNAMIFGYAKQGQGVLALELYARMQLEGLQPNARTFVCALKACNSLTALEKGKEVDGKSVKTRCLEEGRLIHGQVVKIGFDSDIFVGTTLVDMYVNCGSMEDARYVFDDLPQHDVVSWTAIISGYAETEESNEALKLFGQMQEQGFSANSLAYVSVLKACGTGTSLETGKKLHSQICSVGLDITATVASALIEMYAKCGSMVDAQQLFDALPTRNIVTWSALLAGYAHHGESRLLFQMFENMRQEGIQPDGVTFASVLTVCSHVGLVDKGQKYFQAMSSQYGITPTVDHYNCIVDLLGRAGQLGEAMAMVEKMPFEPNVIIWMTMLGACQKWKNVEVARCAFEHAVRLDEKRAAAYILMSNIYADAHMWEDYVHIQLMISRPTHGRIQERASGLMSEEWCDEL